MRTINVLKRILLTGFSVVSMLSNAEIQKTIAFKGGEKTMQSTSTREGYIQFHGYKTWYRIVGKDEHPGKYPLICLHGGPGFPHGYLKPLEEIAKTGRQVIFYDQLGCGNSDRPTDNNLWTTTLFKDELTALIKKLKIERYHVLGQSWGGMLALEHALDRPQGLQSLILASSTSSMPQWISEAKRLRKELPQAVQDILNKHEADGTTQSLAYEEATMKFYNLYICRLNPWPESFKQARTKAGRPVYLKMWGINEFNITGNLKNWDIHNRLAEIRIPTLITSGKYDEATPLINKTLHDGIAHSEWVLFEKSAHLSHMEEPDLYIKVLSDFLDTIDKT